MAKPSRATQAKRERERSKQEKQAEKRELRAMRKEADSQRTEEALLSGEDPDLIGIYPGPQPPQEY
jgi:hypothetical protein